MAAYFLTMTRLSVIRPTARRPRFSAEMLDKIGQRQLYETGASSASTIPHQHTFKTNSGGSKWWNNRSAVPYRGLEIFKLQKSTSGKIAWDARKSICGWALPRPIGSWRAAFLGSSWILEFRGVQGDSKGVEKKIDGDCWSMPSPLIQISVSATEDEHA